MDLYEALKAGTSSKELLDSFNKELEAAQKRLDEDAAEEKALKQEYLEGCREDLVDSISNYLDALLDTDPSLEGITTDVEVIDKALIEFEKEIADKLSFFKKWEKDIKEITNTLNKSSKDKSKSLKVTIPSVDQAIIDNFIKGL